MENIMLRDSRKKHIKIIDFGLSNWYNGGKQPQTHCGSPEYAAPELFYEDRKYGPEVDLWSLGVILYGMMAGQLPFSSPRNNQTSAEEWRDRLMKQIFRGLTGLQEKRISAMSSDYKDLVKRLLQLQPHRRIPMWQICRHPWIVCKDKNMANALLSAERALDPIELGAISEEICAATKTNPTTVEKELRDVHCGDILGMFNIMYVLMDLAALLLVKPGVEMRAVNVIGNFPVEKDGTGFEVTVPRTSLDHRRCRAVGKWCASAFGRRPVVGKYFGRQTTSAATCAPKSSLNRRGLFADKSHSNTLTLETAKGSKTLSLIGKPLRSTCPMRNSLQSWFRQNETKSEQTDLGLVIDRCTIKSAGNGGTIFARPMIQPHLVRSTLAGQVSSSLSKTSYDSRSRPSCPGPSFVTPNTSYLGLERSLDNESSSSQRRQRHSMPSVSQYSHTESISMWPDIAKKSQHCRGGAMSPRDRAGGRRLLRSDTSVKSTTKRYEHQKIRPQSLEITSELLERAKSYSRPSASMNKRHI